MVKRNDRAESTTPWEYHAALLPVRFRDKGLPAGTDDRGSNLTTTAFSTGRLMTAFDAVDGSSTGTEVPSMWALLRLPRFGGANLCITLTAAERARDRDADLRRQPRDSEQRLEKAALLGFIGGVSGEDWKVGRPLAGSIDPLALDDRLTGPSWCCSHKSFPGGVKFDL
jgi:hypothetical protein